MAGPLLAAGCGGVSHVDAPTVTVVTSLYPLAQAVSEVGAAQVHVVDLARTGVDPRTMTLSRGQVAQVRRADLVVDIGGGFQPSVEAAAKHARRTLALLPALGGGNPYLWLDPPTMTRAASMIRSALTRIEPAAKAVFANGADDLVAELSSLDIDFRASLSICPDKTFVTSDDAFARLARYGVVDRSVGTSAQPDAAEVGAAAAAITASHTVAAFEEPYVNHVVVAAAARQAGVKLQTLDTFETPPASGGPAEVSYSNLMEQDLSALSDALQCPATDQS